MGHYRGEMTCIGCGEVRCICNKEPRKYEGYVVHPKTFQVLSSKEFVELFGHMAWVLTLLDGVFQTRATAEKAAARMLDQKIEETKKLLLDLEETKKETPWKK